MRLVNLFQSSPGPEARCYDNLDDVRPPHGQRFNPHRARRPGATTAWALRSFATTRFNPHRARRPGATPAPLRAGRTPTEFQSSPGPEARCYAEVGGSAKIYGSFNPHRARRPGATGRGSCAPGDLSSFNPHRARRPGATSNLLRGGRETSCFNPHRARRPGATYPCFAEYYGASEVSILTGPGGPVLRRAIVHDHAVVEVSILTGPGGPVLRLMTSAPGAEKMFQSSPGPEARCYGSWVPRLQRGSKFQSSPGPEARCYNQRVMSLQPTPLFQSSPGPEARCYRVERFHSRNSLPVSILTGPGGPVLRCRRGGREGCRCSFNPHRARRPGATPCLSK